MEQSLKDFEDAVASDVFSDDEIEVWYYGLALTFPGKVREAQSILEKFRPAILQRIRDKTSHGRF